MIQTHYIMYGTMSGLLLLCAIILSTSEDSQRLVYAQITPAPSKTGGSNDDLYTNSSPDTGGSSITPSPNSETRGQDTTSSDEHDSTNASDLNDSTSEEQVDGATSNGNIDSDPTNQLVEAIMNEVNEALSASGIFGP